MSVFPADTAQVITHPRQRSEAHYVPWQQQVTSLFMGMRNVGVLPSWQPAAQLFPDRQEPDSGAPGQCALREDGRKRMGSHVTSGPQPHEVTRKMDTEAAVRF